MPLVRPADVSLQPSLSAINTVELETVCKSYDHFVAVDDLSLHIRAGSVYGLLGPNGAGKTSTIRMMIGITAPDSGAIRLFGEPFCRRHLARVGYLPEERGLYKRMKLLDQLVFLAELKGVAAADAVGKAVWWCERLELGAWMNRKIEELSKGMQQKVQFIATLLHDPELLILDEPFAGLDPANVVALKDILLEMKQAGKTILFSTHRMDQVERLCDSICLIDHGKVVLQGELNQIKSRFGRNDVQLEYEGEIAFLGDNALVQSYNNYGNYVEVRLRPGADPQDLLHLAASRARINKFHLMEPSLEEIFLQEVGRGDA
jgi:ABC-2 type transport system ATP-binding protein